MYKQIKYIFIDVDGTMTDAGIYYDENGNELKKFCTRDAAVFFAVKLCGIKNVIVTGRESKATERRLKELKADYVCQGVKNKELFLKEFMSNNNIKYDEVGYIGDDLNDLYAMKLAGFVGCPADSCEEVKLISNYVSNVKGGEGAVRDIISYILKQRGEWETAIKKIYNVGI